LIHFKTSETKLQFVISHAKWRRFGSYCSSSVCQRPVQQGKIQQIMATIPTISRFHRFHNAHHLWRQGHQTFSGFIKARERPGKRERLEKERPENQKKKRAKPRNWTENHWRNREGKPSTQRKKSRGRRGEETGEKASVPSFALVFRARAIGPENQRQKKKRKTTGGKKESRNRRKAGETGKKNRETRRNKNAKSKGERGQHTHTVKRIIFETVFVLANKGKDQYSFKEHHSKPASSLLFPSSSQELQ